MAQLVGSFQDAVFQFGVADITVNGVANAKQFMSIEDDEFRIGHEHFRRLIVFDGQYKGIDGIAEIRGVRLSLAPIKLHNVPVIVANLRTVTVFVIINI